MQSTTSQTPDIPDDAPAVLHSPTRVTIGEAGSSRAIRLADPPGPEQTFDAPLRKRQRTDAEEFEDMLAANRVDSMTFENPRRFAPERDCCVRSNVTSRDELYYRGDGDCVIRVENTLFKVHRFLLARDSSAFQHMFSMPGHEPGRNAIDMEGASDDRPIILPGESAENFRALLSVMYALPAELQLYTTKFSPIPTLLTIVQLTNKYHFTTTENWAISALYEVLTSETTLHRHYDLMHCKPSLLRRVVEVALLCQHESLRDFAIDRWIQRLMARDVNPLGAMDAADEFGLVKLKGVSYYVTLLECGDRLQWDMPSFSSDSEDEDESIIADDGNTIQTARSTPASRRTSPSPPPTLSAQQKARLLSGFFSLTNLWDRLRLTAPGFDKPPGCTYHAHGCLSTWRTIWQTTSKSDETLKYRSADVLGRLKSMESQLLRDADLHCALTPTCRRAAMESVRNLWQQVEDSLAEHFVDMTR